MKRYGLIGKRLGHSFSKTYFTEKFEKEGIDARYDNFEIDCITQIKDLIDDNPDLEGFNITIPYKEEIIPLLDTLDPLASRAGAVNVVKVEKGKGGKLSNSFRLHGYNSDVEGFNCLVSYMLEGEREALVLGTGGASGAVRVALEDLGITARFVSRSRSKGDLTYGDLTPEVIRNAPLIINTTPVGMWPDVDACPDIPYEALTDAHKCIDLIYNPLETKFMTRALMQGATVACGLRMLHRQAEVAWDIWTRRESSH